MRLSAWILALGLLILSPLSWAASDLELTVLAETPELMPNLSQQLPGDDSFVLNLSHPPLVALDRRFEWVCQVCENIPELKRQRIQGRRKQKKDVYVSQWRIRADYYWQDGTPVIGQDVKRTLDHMRAHLPLINKMVRKILIDPVDPRAFKIVYRRSFTEYAKLLAIRLIPPPLKEGETAIVASYGPWKIDSWDKDSIRLVPNPFYKQPTPDLDSIVVKSYQSSLLPKYSSSTQNWLALLDPSQWYDDAQNLPTNIVLEPFVSTYLDVIVFNLRNPKFADRRLRQALSLALDREAINQDQYRGDGYGVSSFVHPSDPMCPVTFPESRGIEQARELLAKSGYNWNAEGQLMVRDKAFRLRVAYANTKKQAHMIALVTQYWKDLGVKLEASAIDPRQFELETLARVQFDDLALSTWKFVPGSLPYEAFNSRHIPAFTNDFKGQNLAAWVNKEVDALLEDYSLETNPQKKKNYCQQLINYFETDRPIIPISLAAAGIMRSPKFDQSEANLSAPMAKSILPHNWYRPRLF